MEPNPQSTQTGILEDQNNRGKTIMIMSSDEEEQKHHETIIISDDDTKEEDESPMIEGGETSQRRLNTRRVSRRRWTLSEDWKLVELVSTHEQSLFLWKSIAAEIPLRSRNSCRVRWLKLWMSEDTGTESRWSELARFLSITREDVTNRWSQRMLAKTSQASASTSFVQNVGSMITNPSPAQGEEAITCGDDNGDTSTMIASTSSPGYSVFHSPDLNISLETNQNQTPSTPFYNFLGVESE